MIMSTGVKIMHCKANDLIFRNKTFFQDLQTILLNQIKDDLKKQIHTNNTLHSITLCI